MAGKARVPFLVTLLCIFSFGLLIPFLGFYWDDWLVIFHAQTGRISDLFTLYSFDRPFSVWTALISVPVMGTSPIRWHLFALVVRVLAVLAMWWALRPLWPKEKGRLAWVALLFAVYPAYFLQSISVSFSQHWIAYGIFFLSLGAMGRAVRRPEKFRAYSTLALLSAGLHMLTLEYFAGLELIRSIYLFIIFSQVGESTRQSLRKVFRAWWPYLAIWVLWTIWRLFVLELPSEPHAPQLLLEFRENPIATVLSFFELVSQSYVQVLWSTWQGLLKPGLLDLSNRAHVLSWAVGVFASISFYFVTTKWLVSKNNEHGRGEMAKWSIALGLSAIFVGLMPTWVIGKTSLELGYGERFALPALFGAALFWAGIIWLFVENVDRRRLIFVVMLGLAVSGHLRAGNNFRLDWQQQVDFYQQLSWRAPDIEAGTAIVSFVPLSEWMPISSTSAAINSLYSQSMDEVQVDYWAFDLDRSLNVRAIEDDEVLESNYRGMQFEADNADSLIFLFQPEAGCLWLLTHLDVHNDYIPFENRSLAAQSNVQRILSESSGRAENQIIFGDLTADSWCFFYQRAELVRQTADWHAVIELMAEAEAKGFSANYGVERLALVEAYVRLENWDAAEEVSGEIVAKHIRNSSMLCAQWEGFANEGLLDDEGLAVHKNVVEVASCKSG
jgi:hypothetical protein